MEHQLTAVRQEQDSLPANLAGGNHPAVPQMGHP